jgi:hypothetical protein
MDRPESPIFHGGAVPAAARLSRIPAFLASSSFIALPMANPPSLAQRRRALRVWLLVGTIIVLSLADLYMTLAHLRSAGMGEANPLARLVISYQSPLLLSLWKCACVGLAALILVLARFRRSSEVACWVSCIVLTALTIHWMRYSVEASAMTQQLNDLSHSDPSSNWVSMGGE